MSFVVNDHAYATVAVEATYGANPGTSSSQMAITADGLVYRQDQTPRRAITSAGEIAHQQNRIGAEGPFEFEANYEIMSRFLYALMGTRETDLGGAAPNDNYFYHLIDTAEPTTGGVLPSLRTTIHRGDLSYLYTGCTPRSATFTHNQGENLLCSFDFAASSVTHTSDAVLSLGTFAPIKSSHLDLFTIAGGTGTQVTMTLTDLIKSYTLTYSNALDDDRWMLGNLNRAQPVRRGPITVELSITFDWDTENFVESSGSALTGGLVFEWMANTYPLTVTCKYENGLATTARRQLVWYMPSGVVTSAPPLMTGQGVQEVTVTLRGHYAAITAGLDALDGIASPTAGAIEASHSALAFRLSNAEDASSL